MSLKDPEKVSLRTIRTSVAYSSASISKTSQSTSESTSRDPPLRHRTNQGQGSGPLVSKRRRAPVTITKTACVNCKKAKAKCDGNAPCSRCTTRTDTLPCVYEAHTKHAKEELVKQIRELRAKNRLSERIFKTLQNSKKAPDILRALNNGESIEGIAQNLDRPHMEEQDGFSPVGSPPSVVGGSGYEPGTQIMPGSSWTTVTHDSTALDHLFQLYFAWVHPVSTLFSEGHFVDSYKGQKQRHCSSPLVNAICALACHFHTHSKASELDYDQLGVHFSDAFLAGFEPDDKSITTIQAAAVMFLVELGRGFGLRASSYLRLATESIAEFSGSSNDELPVVLKNTIQGIRCLNVEWAQVTFQFPTNVGFHAVENNHEEASLDESPWYFYRHKEDQCPAWPSLLATTNREKIKLIRIINDVSTIICHPLPNTITACHILEQYGRFTAWREALPPMLGDAETSTRALPHVLSLLVLYDYSIVQLLSPLLELGGFSFRLVNEVVWTHAHHALLLLERHYRLHYTCRYQPALQMFVVLNICHLIARFFPAKPTNDLAIKDVSEAVAIGVEILHESSIGFPAAGALQELLRRSAVTYSLGLPQSLDNIRTPQGNMRTSYSHDDFIDVCTRPSYHQPLRGMCEKLDSKFAEDWYSQSSKFGFTLRNQASKVRRSSRVSRIEVSCRLGTC